MNVADELVQNTLISSLLGAHHENIADAPPTCKLHMTILISACVATGYATACPRCIPEAGLLGSYSKNTNQVYF